MYNHLYQYLTKNNFLFSKQIGFQKRDSTDHVIIGFAGQILEVLESFIYTHGVFINLLKVLIQSITQYRRNPPEVLSEKGVLTICSNFTGEHPCRGVISMKVKLEFETYFLKNWNYMV